MDRPVPNSLVQGLYVFSQGGYGFCMCCGVTYRKKREAIYYTRSHMVGNYIQHSDLETPSTGPSDLSGTLEDFLNPTKEGWVHDHFIVKDKERGRTLMLGWVDEDTEGNLFGKPNPPEPPSRDALGRFSTKEAM